MFEELQRRHREQQQVLRRVHQQGEAAAKQRVAELLAQSEGLPSGFHGYRLSATTRNRRTQERLFVYRNEQGGTIVANPRGIRTRRLAISVARARMAPAAGRHDLMRATGLPHHPPPASDRRSDHILFRIRQTNKTDLVLYALEQEQR